jgi:putative transcriptional regulator
MNGQFDFTALTVGTALNFYTPNVALVVSCVTFLSISGDRPNQIAGFEPLWIKQYDFAMFIKEARVQLALSQEDLAREIGVSYATVNRWENGRFMPSKMALRQIEAYFHRIIEMGRLLLPDERRLL